MNLGARRHAALGEEGKRHMTCREKKQRQHESPTLVTLPRDKNSTAGAPPAVHAIQAGRPRPHARRHAVFHTKHTWSQDTLTPHITKDRGKEETGHLGLSPMCAGAVGEQRSKGTGHRGHTGRGGQDEENHRKNGESQLDWAHMHVGTRGSGT